MSLVITDCELYYNQRNGISISDYWKGPVEVSDCVIVGNLEYALSMQGKVSLDATDKINLQRFDPYKKMQKSNSVAPVTQETERQMI